MIRQAIHPSNSKHLTTDELRRNYLIEEIFVPNTISSTYSMYDRYIVGGAMPKSKILELEVIDMLKADFFLQRREMGIINIGEAGTVVTDGKEHLLKSKEALYIGQGTREVKFLPGQNGAQPLFYYNSAPAHHAYTTKKVTLQEAEKVELGSMENANQRTIYKLLIDGVIQTCQLQMGLTELKAGSVWNTMPPHTHNRRMEIYFYFNVKSDQAVCHFMGEPNETRPLWIKDKQAIISPPWSIHAGVGTCNYAFIWGMAGENLDYNDMDIVQPFNLR